MEIRHYLSIIRRRLALIVVILGAALVAGWFVTPRAHTYTATTTLYVGSQSIDINPNAGQLSADRVAGLDRLITTFTQLVRTRPIAVAAVRTSGVARSPGQIQGDTNAKQAPETNLMYVS